MDTRLSEEAKNWLKSVDYDNRTPYQKQILLKAALILYPYKKKRRNGNPDKPRFKQPGFYFF